MFEWPNINQKLRKKFCAFSCLTSPCFHHFGTHCAKTRKLSAPCNAQLVGKLPKFAAPNYAWIRFNWRHFVYKEFTCSLMKMISEQQRRSVPCSMNISTAKYFPPFKKCSNLVRKYRREKRRKNTKSDQTKWTKLRKLSQNIQLQLIFETQPSQRPSFGPSVEKR